MGYSHYWTPGNRVIKKEALSIIKKICDHGLKAGILTNDDSDPDKLSITNKAIRFNGVGDNAHETFLYEVKGTDWLSCKTARKPYDLYVCAVLLVLNVFHAKSISSDGDIVENEWLDAIQFLYDNEEEFGIAFGTMQNIEDQAKEALG